VFEKVVAQFDQSGSLKGIPEQTTRVSAVGSSPVTVSVPVTTTRVHKKDKGSRPEVVSQEARITLDPNGTAIQELKSKFHGPLPVKATITYSLDGKPISSKHIGRKSGTLEVHYKLANVTSESVAACFEGFDGKQQHLTVSAQVPIVASLSLTVPSEATNFEAPGASLSTGRKGVSVGWTESLFEPLGAASQTFTVKMKMTHVSIPKVSLYLFTVDPRVIKGSVPAKTAAAVGTASAEQAKVVASIQDQLDALQNGASSLSAAPSSKASGSKATTVPKAGSSPHGKTTTTTPSRHLSSADRADTRTDTSPCTGTAPCTTTRRRGTLETALANLSTSLASFEKIHAELSHKTAALLVLTARVRKDAGAVTAQLHDTASQLTGPVQKALQAVQQLRQLQTDLGAFSPDVKSTPAYGKLASDLQLARSTANQLQSSLQGVHQRTQSARAGLGTLQSDLASLRTTAAAAATLAAQAARSTVGNDLADARSKVLENVTGAETQLSSAEAAYAAAKASLAKAVASEEAAVKKTVALRKAGATTAATQKAAALQKAAAAQVVSAQKTVAEKEAALRSAAAKQAQQAVSSLQTSLTESQTQLTKVDGEIKGELAKANADYARILALNELAVLNQLPGGSATGATTQNGRFAYSIG
jgi:hypothetical protein